MLGSLDMPNVVPAAVRGGLAGLLLALLMLPAVSLLREASAGEFYTYTDEKGIVVMTNSLEQVPKRFRLQAKVTRMKDLPAEAGARTPLPAAEPQDGFDWRSKVGRVMDYLPDTIISGLNKRQSVLLIGGFLAGAVAFGVMIMTRSPAIRFAMKWALMFVGFGVMYALYFTQLETRSAEILGQPDGSAAHPVSLMDRVKIEAAEIEQTQDTRARHLDELTK